MAVDVQIGSIETRLSAADPEVLRTPQLMAAIVAMAKQELERDRQLEDRREADMAPSPGGRRR
jgi:hypothetical protein